MPGQINLEVHANSDPDAAQNQPEQHPKKKAKKGNYRASKYFISRDQQFKYLLMLYKPFESTDNLDSDLRFSDTTITFERAWALYAHRVMKNIITCSSQLKEEFKYIQNVLLGRETYLFLKASSQGSSNFSFSDIANLNDIPNSDIPFNFQMINPVALSSQMINPIVLSSQQLPEHHLNDEIAMEK